MELITALARKIALADAQEASKIEAARPRESA